ncbi:MAG: gluconokinase [Chryseolinea sp.]
MSYVIGIDIGTGSTKGVAVDASGKVLHTSQQSYPTLRPEPTFSEQDPEKIWHAFIQCIARISATLAQQPQAIVLSSAMHSLIPMDNGGRPLMNMITWADNRSALVAERIKNSNDGEAIYATCGTPIHAMTPLCKILWLKENNRDLFDRTEKFISIKEFIWYKLFNVFEVDYSIASATGLFDIVSCKWNPLSLKTCSISADKLSIPVETTHLRKDLTSSLAGVLKINSDTPFIAGGSDGCLANVGSFAIKHGTAALTIGTSGAIRVAAKAPAVNFAAMTFNYRLFDDLFISGGPINNGGATLKWYAESFLNIKLEKSSDYDALLSAAEQTDSGANGLIFLPYLLGERAPIWNSDSSGVFFGIRNYHTQAHFTRAVIEGVSLALYSIMTAMESSGLEIDQVNVSGGFVRSTVWLQILADIFNKPIVLIHDEDASAIGAAFIGMKVLGLIKEFSELDDNDHKSFMPRASHHRTYETIFQVYESLYKKIAPEMSQLMRFNRGE